MAKETPEEIIRWLRIATKEDMYPMYTEQEIYDLYKFYGECKNLTAYRILHDKAFNGGIQITGLSVPDVESYFLRLAIQYRPNNSGIL